MQSVGNMQVVPLILDMPEDERFVPPSLTVGTSDYGTVKLTNPHAEKATIAPVGSAYITKQHAQDHAIMGAKIVGSLRTATIKDAACIQSSQGGLIRNEQVELQILPYSIRETSLGLRGKCGYSKLWDSIGKFNRAVGIARSADHLEYYVQTQAKVMDQFVAEFEVLPNQIGAIILINGVVYGVERAPNTSYWHSVWKPLIRMCYGSQAIIEAKKTSSESDRTNTSVSPNVSSLAELKSALRSAEAAHSRSAIRIVSRLLDDVFSIDDDESCSIEEDVLHQLTLANDQFVGQVILDGERVCYASLITKKNWHKNASWREADTFSLDDED
jgi:hypothetical protein